MSHYDGSDWLDDDDDEPDAIEVGATDDRGAVVGCVTEARFRAIWDAIGLTLAGIIAGVSAAMIVLRW